MSAHSLSLWYVCQIPDPRTATISLLPSPFLFSSWIKSFSPGTAGTLSSFTLVYCELPPREKERGFTILRPSVTLELLLPGRLTGKRLLSAPLHFFSTPFVIHRGLPFLAAAAAHHPEKAALLTDVDGKSRPPRRKREASLHLPSPSKSDGFKAFFFHDPLSPSHAETEPAHLPFSSRASSSPASSEDKK